MMTEACALSDALRDFYSRCHRLMDRLMATSGASLARTKLLAYIAEEGPLRSADVVDHFGHAPRTVTEAIDALERDGLVRREPDRDDRRAKRISITAAGLAAIAASEPVQCAFVEQVFAALDSEERATLGALVGRLNRRLEEMNTALRQGQAPPAERG